jgi:hypothetical protein
VKLKVEALYGLEEVDGRTHAGHIRQVKGMRIVVDRKQLNWPYLNIFAGRRLLKATVSLEELSLP